MNDLNQLLIGYGHFVNVKMKSGSDILSQLTPEKCDLIHTAMGVSGEAGELLDAIKKHAMYNKPLDMDNIREEAGDLLFYWMNLLNKLDLPIHEIIRENMAKLDKRYAAGYSDAEAQARADKN